MMFAIRILSGIVSSATLPTAMAYIADTTSGAERSKGMDILGAAMGLGMIIGPALVGWLGKINYLWSTHIFSRDAANYTDPKYNIAVLNYFRI